MPDQKGFLAGGVQRSTTHGVMCLIKWDSGGTRVYNSWCYVPDQKGFWGVQRSTTHGVICLIKWDSGGTKVYNSWYYVPDQKGFWVEQGSTTSFCTGAENNQYMLTK